MNREEIKTVLSLFDGMSCAKIALTNLGIKNRYYASEINRASMIISNKNFPDIIQLGDVTTIDTTKLGKIDLLVAGSPCLQLSSLNPNGGGLHGKESGLFFEFIRIKNELNPKYFLLENVASMSKESKQIMTDLVGVEPILINSNLFTAQNRRRLYWTNIPINLENLPNNTEVLKDILEDNPQIYPLTIGMQKSFNKKSLNRKNREWKPTDINKKAGALLASYGKLPIEGSYIKCEKSITGIRKLTPIEFERLQGLTDNYTEGVSTIERYKMIGNGFTIPVIEFILNGIK